MNLSDYAHDAADRGWGPGWPTNRTADMARVTADRSGTAVNVHKRLARLVDMLLDATEAKGYLLDQTQTGAFNCRPIAGTNVPSNHSWGLAADLNWRRNPVSHDGRAHTDFPAWLVPMWNRYGFAWGGDYSGDYRDAMHLEFMGTPAEADSLTAQALRALEEEDPMAAFSTDDLVAAAYAGAKKALNEGTGAGQPSWAETSQAVLGTVQAVVNLEKAEAAQLRAVGAAIGDSQSAVLGAVAALPTAGLSDEDRTQLASQIAALVGEHGITVDTAAIAAALGADLAGRLAA